MKRAIHWFRRDLRVTDNTALAEAGRRAEQVVPVFILEEALQTDPDLGAGRLAFLLRSVESLRQNLASLGYPLLVRRGRAEIELPKLAREVEAEAVFCNRHYEPCVQARDQRVFNALNAAGVGFELFKDAVLWEERDLLTQAGHPFTVFTPYSKAWKARKAPPPRPRLSPTRERFPRARSDPLPVDPAELGHPLRQTPPDASEEAALRTLDHFLEGPVFRYAETRNIPAADGTSKLSPHLCAGTIGPRTVLARLAAVRPKAAPAPRASCDVFLNELIWREFYLQILANFPHVLKGAFRAKYNELAWSDREDHFQAWCQGQTGYPIVDAAMRCLNATGWMHNRLRMIVAMFLTKDLLLHWQRGERYFMQQLVDGDLAANNGGWQWSAGTGTDAAPYFRIFNPVTQGEQFDPNGAFVRRWLPELDSLPDDVIHRPWANPQLARTLRYPRRLVRHEAQRAKCLALFRKLKPHA